MVDIKTEDGGIDKTVYCFSVCKLFGCILYCIWGLGIFFIPFYVDLPVIFNIPFFIGGGLFIYVSLISLLVHLANHAYRSSDWDKNELITVTTLWFFGVFIIIGSAYFGFRGAWKLVFNIPGIFIILIGLAGSIYELSKRETKGAGRYWLPGLLWLVAAIILHIVKVTVDIWFVFEMAIGICVILCLIGGFSFLLPIVPYKHLTPKSAKKYWKPVHHAHLKNPEECQQSESEMELANVSIIVYRFMIFLSLLTLLCILFICTN